MNDIVISNSPSILIADPYEEYNRILSERSDVLVDRVMPIYAPDDKGTPVCVGTGNLIKASARNFLVTAAHVVRNNHLQERKTLYLPAEDGLIAIEARAEISAGAHDDHTNDPYDICAMELPSEAATALEATPYIFTELNRERKTRFEASQFLVCFLGFPFSKNKGYVGKIKPSPYSFRSNVLSDEEFQRMIDNGTFQNIHGISPATHYVISFKKSTTVKTSGERTTFPLMHGMSGAGLFTVSHIDMESVLGNNHKTSFIGIFHSGISIDHDEMLLIFTNHLPILEIVERFFS